MFQWLQRLFNRSRPRSFKGPAIQLKHFGPHDKPISPHATWEQSHLNVMVQRRETVHLFEMHLANLHQCQLIYRFQISCTELKTKVYAELWCRVSGVGEFFSRGLEQQLSGTHHDTTVEILFLLEKGQFADHLKLNLVMEGPGQVLLRGIEVLIRPLAD